MYKFLSRLKYYFIVLLFVTGSGVFPQVFLTEKKTLDEIQKTALEQSSLIRAESAQASAEIARQKESFSTGSWRASLSGGYKYAPDYSGGIFRSSVSRETGFPGYSWRVKKLQKESEAYAKALEQAARTEVLTGVTLAALRYSYAVESVEHFSEREPHIRVLRSFVSSRGFASPEKRAERYVAVNRIRELELYERELFLERDQAWSELSRYVVSEEMFEIRFEFPDFSVLEKKGEDWKYLLDHNAELRMMEAEEKALQYRAALEKNSGYGRPSLSAFYEQEPSSTTDRYFGAGIEVPLSYIDPKAKARAEATSWEAKSIAERRKLIEKELRSKWESQRVRYERSLEQLNNLKGSNDSDWARISADFVKGQVSLITYLEAEEAHHEWEHEQLRLHYEILEAWVTLQALEGREIFPGESK